MEVPQGHKNMTAVCLYELLGTALLLISINWSAAFNNGMHSLQPFAIGLLLTANIMMFGAISGGHFNPAVTTGVLIRESSNIAHNIPYYIVIVISQILGACVGCFIVFLTI